MEQLHEHNQRTYENICRMYGEGIQRVAVVQPTGSGKSLLMAKLIEDNPDSRFFVLSTSHKINDQFKEKLDEEALKRVDFNIYCNMSSMNEETMKALQADYILLDEMHRALAKEWSKGIKILLEMYPNAKVLGLSATPIRYLDRCRNVVEELFNGNLACDMSLSQAILDGILPMARYVCGVYSFEKDAESLNRRIAKSCNSDEEKKELLEQVKVLKQNLDKANGVSEIIRKYVVSGNEKFVVFLKDTTHLRDMKPVIEKWFTDAGFTVRMYEVHSKNVDKDREFQSFKEDTEDGIIKACLSVNMIAEGIHGDIDGVIMLRETMSPNLYFQMIGRAFSCGKKTIPLIFDLVANSQFISDAVDNFPNELKGEIEKRKEECEKEGKDYEVGFDVDEFIVMDEFMDAISGFRAIEGRLKGREWTEEENEILKKWYLIEGTKVADKLEGRTKYAVKGQARKLGLNINSCKPWTEKEIEILKKYYPTEGLKVIDRLEGRTKSSIVTKAYKLDIKAPDNSWTDEEIEILKEYYPVEGISVERRLNNKTRVSIQAMANSLKIKQIGRIWTEKEVEILKKYYPIEGTNVKERLNNKGMNSIKRKAKSLNIKYKKGNFSEKEDEMIRKYYPSEGSNVYKRLDNKTKREVISHAAYLKVIYTNNNKWSDRDYEILKKY
ncbi:MAG: DEAD/DEAH box helicase family protein, partial [Lachnospiraceae bacterium]|nr:DEAD/DEAH box helicase family protein [Lachnospiraceae bacterium]